MNNIICNGKLISNNLVYIDTKDGINVINMNKVKYIEAVNNNRYNIVLDDDVKFQVNENVMRQFKDICDYIIE